MSHRARPAGPSPSLLSTHLHALALLGSYTLQFPHLVSSPQAGLFSSLLPLCAIQTCYAVLCLGGPTGPSSTSSSSSSSSRKPKTAATAAGIRPRRVVEIGGGGGVGGFTHHVLPITLSLLLTSTLGTIALGILLVLFGAPFTTHIPHTLLAAMHLALLIVFPLVYTHKLDSAKWHDIFALTLPLDEVFAAAVGTMIGAWCGAVPIPLDWDQPWQQWPLTVVTGAYIGNVVGKLAGIYLLNGKRLVF